MRSISLITPVVIIMLAAAGCGEGGASHSESDARDRAKPLPRASATDPTGDPEDENGKRRPGETFLDITKIGARALKGDYRTYRFRVETAGAPQAGTIYAVSIYSPDGEHGARVELRNHGPSDYDATIYNMDTNKQEPLNQRVEYGDSSVEIDVPADSLPSGEPFGFAVTVATTGAAVETKDAAPDPGDGATPALLRVG